MLKSRSAAILSGVYADEPARGVSFIERRRRPGDLIKLGKKKKLEVRSDPKKSTWRLELEEKNFFFVRLLGGDITAFEGMIKFDLIVESDKK